MRLVEQMLLDLNDAFDGDPWHGQSLKTIIDGVDPATTDVRPIAGAHTIAELLAHITVWIDVVQRRLGGEVVLPTEAEDYPRADGGNWGQAVGRLQQAHTRLVDRVARMSDADFEAVVPGKDYSAGFMLHGIIRHNIYHSGQIALLKKG